MFTIPDSRSSLPSLSLAKARARRAHRHPLGRVDAGGRGRRQGHRLLLRVHAQGAGRGHAGEGGAGDGWDLRSWRGGNADEGLEGVALQLSVSNELTGWTGVEGLGSDVLECDPCSQETYAFPVGDFASPLRCLACISVFQRSLARAKCVEHETCLAHPRTYANLLS
eukprot:6184202-Pleurochrysis_carterae.AAC.1